MRKILITGKMPKIESKFNIDYQFVLKAMINKMLDNNLIVNKSLKEQEKVVIRSSLLKDLENAKEELAKFTNIEEKLESKEKDVVKSYRNYYIFEKSKFAVWKSGYTPDWFLLN